MSDIIYIHYGASEFDPTKGFPIHNYLCGVKPRGGLWASRKDATYGWKYWCEAECFRDCDDANAFRFILRPDAKVARIFTLEDLYSLPEAKTMPKCVSKYRIDFEQCLRDGIDAIELCYYGKEFNKNPSFDIR